MQRQESILTVTVFHILFALRAEDLHGYEIIKRIHADSDGKIRILTGTLYGAIKRLLEEKLIEEADNRPDENDDERRRYYRLTEKGRSALGAELSRYQSVVKIAAQHQLLKPLSYV